MAGEDAGADVQAVEEGEGGEDVGDVGWVGGGVGGGGEVGGVGGVRGEAVVEGDEACDFLRGWWLVLVLLLLLVLLLVLQAAEEGGGGWGEGGRGYARVAPGAAVDEEDPGAGEVGDGGGCRRGGGGGVGCGRDPDVEGLQGEGLAEWEIGDAGLVPADRGVAAGVGGVRVGRRRPGHRGPRGQIGLGWQGWLHIVAVVVGLV